MDNLDDINLDYKWERDDMGFSDYLDEKFRLRNEWLEVKKSSNYCDNEHEDDGDDALPCWNRLPVG